MNSYLLPSLIKFFYYSQKICQLNFFITWGLRSNNFAELALGFGSDLAVRVSTFNF